MMNLSQEPTNCLKNVLGIVGRKIGQEASIFLKYLLEKLGGWDVRMEVHD